MRDLVTDEETERFEARIRTALRGAPGHPRVRLVVVRDSAPPPPLKLPPPAWWDRPWFGAAIVAVMFLGVGAIAVALGWIHP